MRGIQGLGSAVPPLEIDRVPTSPPLLGSACRDEFSLVVKVGESTGKIADPSGNVVSPLAFGCGSTVFESNLADSLCCLASSTGRNTLDLSRDRFAFVPLERKPFAIGMSARGLRRGFGSRCADSTS